MRLTWVINEQNNSLFPPNLVGEELYTQMDFFCSVNFGDQYIRVESGSSRKPIHC